MSATLTEHAIDLVVLDLGLPVMKTRNDDCRKLREDSAIPVNHVDRRTR